jgi:hypothetical protein
LSDHTAASAYRALQRRAREEGRGTQELLELYIHERFLCRLAGSRYKEQLVLKGGMLLAALDARRATRDADFLARRLPHEQVTLERVIGEIATITLEDGVTFDPDRISMTTIREEADYPGLRAKLPAAVDTARLNLALDINFGDLVTPTPIAYPTLLEDEPFTILGYPLEMLMAEKAETMMARGDANTRERDFADLLILSRRHTIDAARLKAALEQVARDRGRTLTPLADVLRTLPDRRQSAWSALRDRINDDTLPADFATVVADVSALIDPILATRPPQRWNPTTRSWE